MPSFQCIKCIKNFRENASLYFYMQNFAMKKFLEYNKKSIVFIMSIQSYGYKF